MSQYRREGHWPLEDASFVADDLGGNIDVMPENVVSAKRKTRQYFNHVLARAEVNGTYRPARKLWARVRMGHYVINPNMQVRVNHNGEGLWKPISEALAFDRLNFPKLKLSVTEKSTEPS